MRKRIPYLDVIRVFACFCVLTVHFNASVSGYDIYGTFVYPNSFIPSDWFGVYLGTLGVGLFFMISGAGMSYSNPKIEKWGYFYLKRFKSIYPSYWLAFLVAFTITFWQKHAFPNAPISHFAISLAGLDGYLMVMGFPGTSLYMLGEWFLGCIVLIYLFYPMVSYLLNRWPILVAAGYSILWGTLLQRVNMNWFFVWGFYVVLGMVFVRIEALKKPRNVWIAFAAFLAARIIFNFWLSYAYNVLLTCCVFFLFFVAVCQSFNHITERIQPTLKKVSALTFPAFLVHHRLISHMASKFDLTVFSTKTYLFLYVQYLILTFLLGWLLSWCSGRVLNFCKIHFPIKKE